MRSSRKSAVSSCPTAAHWQGSQLHQFKDALAERMAIAAHPTL
jgi:hypothetical protein